MAFLTYIYVYLSRAHDRGNQTPSLHTVSHHHPPISKHPQHYPSIYLLVSFPHYIATLSLLRHFPFLDSCSINLNRTLFVTVTRELRCCIAYWHSHIHKLKYHGYSLHPLLWLPWIRFFFGIYKVIKFFSTAIYFLNNI